MKDFYSVKEFCELIGIDRSTLYRWIKAGKIEYIQSTPNGKISIPATVIQELTRRKAPPEVQNNGE